MLKEGVILGERYEIISRIGSGGMADVYKAKDHKLNRMVAVKVLKPEFREDKTFIRKFRTEAQAAAGLSHPNIVNVYDVGEDRGVYYIVMELVEGITLKDYIDRKGKLSVKEATSIAIQVSLGLEAAHNRNIVHRDVKPQNIIISTDGKVKLSDFGIAKATSSNTISSNVMGSVHYSSPEQVRGGYSDYKSDIYSLGITMYEMVTGRVPFDGDTTVAIAIKHLQEEIESPSKYTPNLPFALEQIILKCTQKSPDRRYNNMAELIDDLKHSLMEPQGNFVKVTPLSSHAETVMVSAEELSQIRSGAAAKANAQTAEEPARKRYSKIEDEEEDEDYSYEDEEDEDEDEEEDDRDSYDEDDDDSYYDDDDDDDRWDDDRWDDDDDDDDDEHEHHHDHDGHCCCGHHHHHHDHDADEVFTSWGVETARKFTKAEVEHALTELDTGNYGMILRSKGIVDGGADGWLEFDYVPGEWEVRARGADVGGKLVVIGSKLDEKAIAALFGC